jgi:hypothetical protein
MNFLVHNYASERAAKDTPKPATLLSVRVVIRRLEAKKEATIVVYVELLIFFFLSLSKHSN